MINFVCPKCRRGLRREGAAYECDGGHTYDVAREGYVNLLLANMKNSANPGDNKQMVEARDKFLSKGYYGFLADKLADIVKENSDDEIALLDAGCGTGYYLSRVLEKRGNVKAVGVDISKEAVKRAAKAVKGADFAVAGVYDLPFADDTFDVVLCVFSPYAYKEYARVLKKGGKLILAYPAAKHLIEIKRKLYGDAAYENEKSPSSHCFERVETTAVEKTFTASGADILSLISMTPYFYKTKEEKLEGLKTIDGMTVTASFEIAVFTK